MFSPMICEADIAPDKVDELKKIIDSFLKKEKEYLSEINILKEQIRCLQDRLFGRKSEKMPSDENLPKQLSLFDPPEEDFPIAERIRIDRVRNEPRSYPVVGQARCFRSAVWYKEISFFDQRGASAF